MLPLPLAPSGPGRARAQHYVLIPGFVAPLSASLDTRVEAGGSGGHASRYALCEPTADRPQLKALASRLGVVIPYKRRVIETFQVGHAVELVHFCVSLPYDQMRDAAVLQAVDRGISR